MVGRRSRRYNGTVEYPPDQTPRFVWACGAYAFRTRFRERSPGKPCGIRGFATCANSETADRRSMPHAAPTMSTVSRMSTLRLEMMAANLEALARIAFIGVKDGTAMQGGPV